MLELLMIVGIFPLAQSLGFCPQLPPGPNRRFLSRCSERGGVPSAQGESRVGGCWLFISHEQHFLSLVCRLCIPGRKPSHFPIKGSGS